MESNTNPDLEQASGLLQAGNAREAEITALHAIATGSQPACAWFFVGAARHRQQRPEAALDAMEQALCHDPDTDDARQACATLLLGLKRPRAALAMIMEIVRRHPDNTKAMVDAGVVMEELGESEGALARYGEALRLSPGDYRARLNRGALLARVGRLEEALADNLYLVRGYIGSAAAHYNLADVLLCLNRHTEALGAAERALRLQPDSAHTLMLRGLALAMMERDEESSASFARARRVDAATAESYRAAAASAVGIAVSQRLTLDPRQIRLARQLERQKDCDWAERERLIAGVRGLAADISKMNVLLEEMGLYHTALSLPLTAGEQQSLAHGLAASTLARAGNAAAPAWKMRRVSQPSSGQRRKIRLGFLSPNFREHPSAQLHWRHLALRDRSRFDVLAYSLHYQDGLLRRRIIESCDSFRELSGLDDREIAARIALDNIDILIDLAGHKDYSRPEVLALRPAPLRVSYLGLPGPMGTELIDYRITDTCTTPEREFAIWSEKLVCLPDTLWIYNDIEAVAETKPGRSECGLPDHGFVFCCFNTSYKIEPDVFSVWMRLLTHLPGSVLWLLDGGEAIKRNLRREAELRGIAAARVIFAPRLPRAEHLARHVCADLFLDTFYYGAHTTAADALWAGLPVLTCLGGTMASRIGASIVRAAGLPELVAPDAATYEAMALRLATHPEELSLLRERLARGRDSCALFTTEKRVRELDCAFEMMWQRHLAGLPPESFSVPEKALA